MLTLVGRGIQELLEIIDYNFQERNENAVPGIAISLTALVIISVLMAAFGLIALCVAYPPTLAFFPLLTMLIVVKLGRAKAGSKPRNT